VPDPDKPPKSELSCDAEPEGILATAEYDLLRPTPKVEFNPTCT
jgi:hypothetical protein